MNLAQLGEFGWIEMLSAKKASGPLVQCGIGDDAAVLRWTSKKDILVTTDMLLENHHFKMKDATAFDIGWKAMAVNVSDIAAMGGLPVAAVVAMGAHPKTSVSFLRRLYQGMNTAASRFHFSLVGGDTNASSRLVLSVTMLGEVEKGQAVLRSTAKPGDWIFVSGTLGGSYKSKKHLRFIPRVKEARILVKHFRPTSMMDISDGLGSDLRRLCQASGVGARVDVTAIPRSKKTLSLAQVLGDGEDFELLFTADPRVGQKILAAKSRHGQAKFSHVGEILLKSQGITLLDCGRIRPFPLLGFDHFR